MKASVDEWGMERGERKIRREALAAGPDEKPRKTLFRAGEVATSIVFARAFAYMD
jgi:hypothetical protein